MRTISKHKCGCQVIQFANSNDFNFCRLHLTAPDGLAIAEKLCKLWAVSQSEESMTFARNEMEEIFKMASALREKASAK